MHIYMCTYAYTLSYAHASSWVRGPRGPPLLADNFLVYWSAGFGPQLSVRWWSLITTMTIVILELLTQNPTWAQAQRAEGLLYLC